MSTFRKVVIVIVKLFDGVGTRLGASSISVNPELINIVFSVFTVTLMEDAPRRVPTPSNNSAITKLTLRSGLIYVVFIFVLPDIFHAVRVAPHR